MKYLKIGIAVLLWPFVFACHYLDIVPDNIATVDNIFRMRSTAEQYLFTCYSYQPKYTHPYEYLTIMGGDEIWGNDFNVNVNKVAWNIAKGFQNVVNPYSNYFGGAQGGRGMFVAIRDCNTFLNGISKVPDMDDYEKVRWAAEVKFLKAYYHFFLFRMYGPIPLMDKNLPITSTSAEVRVKRASVDSCVNYIARLLDEAVTDLPDRIDNEATENGRVTKAIALSVKAQLLVTAASPLFNGNSDYGTFAGKDGEKLFPQYDEQKWKRAADACKAAIDQCHTVGNKLYVFNPAFYPFTLSDDTKVELSVRNSITERWNKEIIWTSTANFVITLQQECLPRLFTGEKQTGTLSSFGTPIKMAELFYTKNGVPISEDKTWDYVNRYSIKTAGNGDFLRIKPAYQTAALNFDREVRFYADLGFDGGRWYGHGRFSDTSNTYLEAKLGQIANNHAWAYSITGYWPKKLVNPQTVSNANEITFQNYPWPVIRLADMYLLYAEALNESEGPTAETMKWIDLVRQRAGLKSVADAWTQFSTNPGAYQQKDGMRKIIHQERLIEMAFEGARFWDLRRWKEAERVLNEPITGWNYGGKTAAEYYTVKLLYNQTFKKRDYLWPIMENDLIVNNNLVQNPGW